MTPPALSKDLFNKGHGARTGAVRDTFPSPPPPNIYKYSIPVVLYDQIDSGDSTRLAEKEGETLFQTFDLYKQELRP